MRFAILSRHSKGLADQLLADAEAQRNATKRHSITPDGPLAGRRSRSRSTSSVDSISTISTEKSRDHSLPRRSATDRRREIDGFQRNQTSRSPERKRKFGSLSSSPRSRSPPERSPPRHKNRRHRTTSPEDRGRPSSDRRGSHRSRSNSLSVDKSQITKLRKSLESTHAYEDSRAYSTDNRQQPERVDGYRQDINRRLLDENQPPRREKRERSLSPYSRRLALTQAMNKR